MTKRKYSYAQKEAIDHVNYYIGLIFI